MGLQRRAPKRPEVFSGPGAGGRGLGGGALSTLGSPGCDASLTSLWAVSSCSLEAPLGAHWEPFF